MTPTEKAKELIDKFNFDLRPFSELGEWDSEVAKKCALIAVDESVNTFISIHHKLTEIDMLKGDVKETATYQYWQEVKQEIKKL